MAEIPTGDPTVDPTLDPTLGSEPTVDPTLDTITEEQEPQKETVQEPAPKEATPSAVNTSIIEELTKKANVNDTLGSHFVNGVKVVGGAIEGSMKYVPVAELGNIAVGQIAISEDGKFYVKESNGVVKALSYEKDVAQLVSDAIAPFLTKEQILELIPEVTENKDKRIAIVGLDSISDGANLDSIVGETPENNQFIEFNSSDENLAREVVVAGVTYTVTTGDNLVFINGEWVKLNVPTPGQTYTPKQATETVAGILRFATIEEVLEGTAVDIAISPANLKAVRDRIAAEMVRVKQELQTRISKNEADITSINSLLSRVPQTILLSADTENETIDLTGLGLSAGNYLSNVTACTVDDNGVYDSSEVFFRAKLNRNANTIEVLKGAKVSNLAVYLAPKFA